MLCNTLSSVHGYAACGLWLGQLQGHLIYWLLLSAYPAASSVLCWGCLISRPLQRLKPQGRGFLCRRFPELCC